MEIAIINNDSVILLILKLFMKIVTILTIVCVFLSCHVLISE